MAIDYQLHRTQVAEIVDNISNGQPVRIDGKEGRKALALIESPCMTLLDQV